MAACTCRSEVKRCGSASATPTSAPGTTPSATPHRIISVVADRAAVDVPGAERLAGQRLGRDRERVEGERGKLHSVAVTWWAASGVARPAATHRGDQHRAQRRVREGYAVARGSQHPPGWGTGEVHLRGIPDEDGDQAAAMPVCAMTGARAEPAIPMPGRRRTAR